MPRPVTYLTEADRKAAIARSKKAYNYKKALAEGKNTSKHEKLKYENSAIKIEIGTMDRYTLDTAYIHVWITTKYTKDTNAINTIKTNCILRLREYLSSCDIWDKRNYITLFDNPDRRSDYHGTTKSFDAQYYLLRRSPLDWEGVVKELTKLSEMLVDTIKKTCQQTGLELKRKLSNNPNYR